MPRYLSGSCLLLVGLTSVQAQTVPALEGEAYRLADAAYRGQMAGDLPGALRSVAAALALAPGHPLLLSLQFDLLYASGALEEADAVLAELQAREPANAGHRLRRIYLRQRQGRPAEALQEAARLASEAAVPTATRRQARLAQADLLQALGRPAEALTELEPLKADPALEVQSRRAFLLLAAGQPGPACAAFEGALGLGPESGQRRNLLHGLCDAARGARRPDLELKALEELRAQDPGDRRAALDLAYAYLARHRDPEALDQFSAALDPQSPPGAWLDAGYAAKRLGRNAEAVRFFSGGIDVRSTSGPQDPELIFGLRREVESLSRSWGLVTGTAYRQGWLTPGLVSQQKILQEGLEAYWQPDGLARNGRMVQVFVQTFESLYSIGEGTTGGPTVQGVIGLRAKPFESENLVLGVQRLVKLGRYSLSDWMFRAAYSRVEGLDLRPQQPDWAYWSLYTEGDTFAQTGHYIHQLEVRGGHAWGLPAGGGQNVLAPYVVLAGDYDNRQGQQTAAGLGLGTSLRHWFREDLHHAPASWVELTVQARARLTTATRGGGLFLTLTCWF